MRAEIRRRLGDMAVDMAEGLGYAYGWEDNPAEPRLTFCVFCCECDRFAAQVLTRAETDHFRAGAGLPTVRELVEERTMRIMAKECSHIDAMQGYPEADRKIVMAKFQEERERWQVGRA